MTQLAQHKRGDTFYISAQLKDSDGVAINITGWSIASQIRDPDGLLIASLTASITTPAEGRYTLTAANTSAWPIGYAMWDIQYTDSNGIVRSTDTIPLNIILDITQPP